jgi:hypothetical protein
MKEFLEFVNKVYRIFRNILNHIYLLSSSYYLIINKLLIMSCSLKFINLFLLILRDLEINFSEMEK